MTRVTFGSRMMLSGVEALRTNSIVKSSEPSMSVSTVKSTVPPIHVLNSGESKVIPPKKNPEKV